MKKIVSALILTLGFTATGYALAEGSGDGGLRTQALAEQKVRELRASMAAKEALSAKTDQEKPKVEVEKSTPAT